MGNISMRSKSCRLLVGFLCFCFIIYSLKGFLCTSLKDGQENLPMKGNINGIQLPIPRSDSGNQLTIPRNDTGNQLTQPRSDTGNQLTKPRSDTGNQLTKPRSDTGNQLTKPRGDTGNQYGSSNIVTSFEPGTKQILINTYMRSGSTFLGKILGHRDDVFYFYEPLHKMWILSYTNGTQLCHYTKPSCVDAKDKLNEALDYLLDVYNCKLHLDQLRHDLLTKGLFGPKWTIFNQCLQIKQPEELCLKKVEDNCRLEKIRVMKVLRLSLRDASSLLTKLPNLTIIQLFRDPRGIINSHITTDWFPMEQESDEKVKLDIIANCNRIKDDIVFGETLVRMYPDRVKIVQYEDIDGDIEKAKIIYKFVGMDMPQTIGSNFYELFQNSKNQTDFLSGPYKYRKTLSFKYNEMFNKYCPDVINKLGFNLFKTEKEFNDPKMNPVKSGKLPFEL